MLEFNKSLEIFEIVSFLIFQSFKANTDQIFNIILQISKFLKEFSDFENCPNFRHP